MACKKRHRLLRCGGKEPTHFAITARELERGQMTLMHSKALSLDRKRTKMLTLDFIMCTG